jgi:hypothetical protein
VRHYVRSRDFARLFRGITSDHLFARLTRFCRGGNGPIGQEEIGLIDVLGIPHAFFIECFHNRSDTLTLGIRHGAASGVTPRTYP